MKTAIVTGATSGIGLAVCRALLQQDYCVLGIGHAAGSSKETREMLAGEYPAGRITFFAADFQQLAEIKRLALALGEYLDGECGGKLEVLINNAGCVRSWYATTPDGYEQQFAVNHLAGFLLTHYLLPYLQQANGRVLMTSSESHKMIRMHWQDIMFRKGYNPLLVYKQSKLCNMLFALALNDRYMANGIQAYGIDPGLVKTDIGQKQTGGLVKLVWSQRKKGGIPPEMAARTYAWVCTQDNAPQGLYYRQSKEARYSRQVTRENADRLFRKSEQLCGISFGRCEK